MMIKDHQRQQSRPSLILAKLVMHPDALSVLPTGLLVCF
jgi:hypothetical protein